MRKSMAATIALEIRYSTGIPTPLLVKLRLVEAGSCEPIRDAVVDIWHPDAAGQYSGYRGPGDDGADTLGETFLRGMQITDANGIVEFETIYRGWYPGRTVHVHIKAYADQRSLVTSQMYFLDDITDIVYLAEPYSARGPRSTRNENDGILTGDTTIRALLGQVRQNGDGYVVSLTIGVVR
jgi:protocatechuate 3,4-dioxygenase beta subunit